MTDTTIVVDGSQGEGGGQILRSSLALSLITGVPLRMHDIRARRAKPGLMRQHLTAVRAAAAVGQAEVQGDGLRSTELSFVPGTVRAGEHHFVVGTAGSTTLVLQTVLWPLLLAPGRSRLVIEGGTHNPMAPTFDFLERSLLPALRRLGAQLELRLERAGFYPAGGGRMVVEIAGGRPLSPARWEQRGEVRRRRATAKVSALSVSIARRELAIVGQRLGWSPSELQVQRVRSSGPGNVLDLELEHEGGTTVVTSFGQKGISAEQVAEEAAQRLEGFLHAQVPVDEHLADQLLIPLALARGGGFRTVAPTLHTRSNAALIERWLPVRIGLQDEGEGAWSVRVESRDPGSARATSTA
ncbi:MAG: RNA 3'-terminal phosphate cyclase [Nannocystaceae bacterium]